VSGGREQHDRADEHRRNDGEHHQRRQTAILAGEPRAAAWSQSIGRHAAGAPVTAQRTGVTRPQREYAV
jgi:hypothetical protein